MGCWCCDMVFQKNPSLCTSKAFSAKAGKQMEMEMDCLLNAVLSILGISFINSFFFYFPECALSQPQSCPPGAKGQNGQEGVPGCKCCETNNPNVNFSSGWPSWQPRATRSFWCPIGRSIVRPSVHPMPLWTTRRSFAAKILHTI